MTDKNAMVGWPAEHYGQPVGFEASREHQAQKVIRVLDYFGFEDRLATPADRLALLDTATPEDFISWLNGMNGLILNLPVSYQRPATETQAIWDANGKEIIEVLPAPEDKVELLTELFTQSHNLTNIDDRALLLSYGINAIHPYLEGNGRLSRLVYYLLSQGFQADDPLLPRILGSNGTEVVNPDPGVIRPTLLTNLQMMWQTHAEPVFPNPATPKIRTVGQKQQDLFKILGIDRAKQEDEWTKMFTIFNDPYIRDMIPVMLLAASNEAAIVSFTSLKGGPPEANFDVDRFFGLATTADRETVYRCFRSITRAYVISLMDALIHSERWQAYYSPSPGVPPAPMPLRDIMRASVAPGLAKS